MGPNFLFLSISQGAKYLHHGGALVEPVGLVLIAAEPKDLNSWNCKELPLLGLCRLVSEHAIYGLDLFRPEIDI